MGKLILLIAALVCGFSAAKRSVVKSWLWFWSSICGIYLSIMLMPVLDGLVKPILKDAGKEFVPYSLPICLLLSLLIFMGVFLFAAANVLPANSESLSMPKLPSKILAFLFAAIYGSALAAFVIILVCATPGSQKIPVKRDSFANSGRNYLTSLVKTINACTLQKTTPEAEECLNRLVPFEQDKSASDSEKESESDSEEKSGKAAEKEAVKEPVKESAKSTENASGKAVKKTEKATPAPRKKEAAVVSSSGDNQSLKPLRRLRKTENQEKEIKQFPD